MTSLRPYQLDVEAGVYQAWAAGHRNVLAVLPTGAGKTTIFSKILADYKGASVAVAHRSELVIQMSLALARNSVRHSVMAPKSVVREIIAVHMAEIGRSYYEPNARCRVAGVDTIVRLDAADPWMQQVGLWVCDEAHHLCTTSGGEPNKWMQTALKFPNAHGLGVTATPVRADGRGLGAHSDGVMHVMVEGPSMRSLIVDGFLSPYRIFAPPSDVDLTNVTISAGGDFSPELLRKAVHKSHVTGDVVAHYLRLAAGKLGVTFTVDVESAVETAAAYRTAGVAAEVLTGKTPALLRAQIMRRFRQREILQLVNCDLLGEGVDVPAIEVVSMARPTASYGLYVQQFGRGCRPLEGKETAIIIDHVGNVLRHGLPDAKRQWSLDRRERRTRKSAPDAIPVRTCVKCLSVYERIYARCPYCGHYEPPAGRSTPAQVDGDLAELSEETLRLMRGEIDQAPTFPMGAGPEVIGRLKRVHFEKQEAQKALRLAMMQWGGGERTGHESQAQRLFYHRFGVDVLSAMALNARDAADLQQRIERDSQL